MSDPTQIKKLLRAMYPDASEQTIHNMLAAETDEDRGMATRILAWHDAEVEVARRGMKNACLACVMPMGSYDQSPEQQAKLELRLGLVRQLIGIPTAINQDPTVRALRQIWDCSNHSEPFPEAITALPAEGNDPPPTEGALEKAE